MTSSQDSSSTERLVAALVAAYILAEQDLLAGLTAIIRRTPATLEGRQLLLVKARRLVRQIMARLDVKSTGLAVRMLDSAARDGAQTAAASVGRELARRGSPVAAGGGSGGRAGGGEFVPRGGEPFDLSMPHGERAAQAIRDDIVSELDDVRRRITRLPDDVYKWIAPHGGIYQVIDNGVTPQQAQAMAWRVFTSQGVTGFTDKSGRDWSLSAYVEMAVRTAAQRAFNDSHLQRMQALGVEYFTVPVSPHTCPKCFPWQGKVLTATPLENPVIPVAGTIADAVAAGLWHPNCRHPLTAVFPGVTELPEVGEWTAEDQRLYDLSQKQRRLELEVRKAKRAVEYAATPEAALDAQVRVRRAQTRVREFVKATGFARQSRREQVNLTDDRIKLPTPIR